MIRSIGIKFLIKVILEPFHIIGIKFFRFLSNADKPHIFHQFSHHFIAYFNAFISKNGSYLSRTQNLAVFIKNILYLNAQGFASFCIPCVIPFIAKNMVVISLENNVVYAKYAREKLDAYGYYKTETICNEWLVEPSAESRGTYKHAAQIAAMMLAWQDTPLDSAMIYDARLGPGIYAGLFNCLTQKPFPAYYSFVAFNELYKLGNQASVSFDGEGVYAVGAAKDNKGCLVIANVTDGEVEAEILCDAKVERIYNAIIPGSGDLPSSKIPAQSVVVIEFSL